MTLAPAAPAALAHGRRPDPALGVFSTLLVIDGEPQRLDAHLARLAGSMSELYDRALPVDLETRVRALARTGRGRARLRIDIAPDADAELVMTPPRKRELPVVLHPYTLPGGLGAHKWRDRTLVDALTQTPLLLDADGSVLEAGWANVLIRRGGVLRRPRADGRILPGTTLPPAEEADLTLDDLRRADEILVSSSIDRRRARGARRRLGHARELAPAGGADDVRRVAQMLVPGMAEGRRADAGLERAEQSVRDVVDQQVDAELAAARHLVVGGPEPVAGAARCRPASAAWRPATAPARWLRMWIECPASCQRLTASTACGYGRAPVIASSVCVSSMHTRSCSSLRRWAFPGNCCS